MKILTAPPPLPDRPHDANKVTAGRVVVVGGSRDMVGAPALAALGAHRAGAGLVRIAVPRSLQPLVAGFRPESTTTGLSEDAAGSLAGSALPELLEHTRGWDAVVLGPGIGRSPGTGEVVRTFARKVRLPLVLDADALFAFNGCVQTLRGCAGPVVLTPHEGEAARLLEVTSAQVQADRQDAAMTLARRSGAIVVLKGPGTLVADVVSDVIPEGASEEARLYRNATGGPVLSTGGTGDVLAGVIGALLAQAAQTGLDAFEAACVGVHVHAAGADTAARGCDRGLFASELAAGIPDALLALRSGSGS